MRREKVDMAQVLLNELTKKFGGVTAVDKVNLQVRDKEFLVSPLKNLARPRRLILFFSSNFIH